MIKEVIENRLKEYAPANTLERENVLSEIIQHYVLASLSRARLFTRAAFHGGTCMRILYGMNRFSEYLDFALTAPDPKFDWKPYLRKILDDGAAEGITFEVQDRNRAETAVRKAFLKTDSIGQVLNLRLPYGRHAAHKIRIKLEVDTNPPAGACYETRYMAFPMTAAVTTMDLGSSFGSKTHALLCREYTKGRDWYDFLWYSSRKITPNLDLLAHALDQQGPWSGQGTIVTPAWLIAAMRKRIGEIDWPAARRDVARFITAREQTGLDLWSEELFQQHTTSLAEVITA